VVATIRIGHVIVERRNLAGMIGDTGDIAVGVVGLSSLIRQCVDGLDEAIVCGHRGDKLGLVAAAVVVRVRLPTESEAIRRGMTQASRMTVDDRAGRENVHTPTGVDREISGLYIEALPSIAPSDKW